jgi:hypothetical protein
VQVSSFNAIWIENIRSIYWIYRKVFFFFSMNEHVLLTKNQLYNITPVKTGTNADMLQATLLQKNTQQLYKPKQQQRINYTCL